MDDIKNSFDPAQLSTFMEHLYDNSHQEGTQYAQALDEQLQINIMDFAPKSQPFALDHAATHANMSQRKISDVLPISEPEINKLIDRLSFGYGHESITSTSTLESSKPSYSEAMSYSSFNVNSIRKDFPILSQKTNNKPLIWLDNAATTQKPQVVIDTIKSFYEHSNSNIHRGNYTLSEQASEMYEATRKSVARFINASSENEIVFVRGATEAINLVANTFGKQYINAGDEIIISLFEHHSNILPWQALARERGAKLRVIPIDHNGELLLEEYGKLLNSKTKLVAITQVSNAIGTVVPVEKMTMMAHHYGACVLVDGAQSTPHMATDVQALGCDFYVFSGHKLFAPTGIGVLYGKFNILNQLTPWQVGGGMIEHVSFESAKYADAPYRFEAGTGNIADVAGLGAAIHYLSQIGLRQIAAYEHELVQYTEQQLLGLSHITLMGRPAQRAGSIPFIIKNIESIKIGRYLNDFGIALRAGHHCAQPTMAFFGVDSMVRPSVAFYNTKDEIDVLIQALIGLYNKML